MIEFLAEFKNFFSQNFIELIPVISGLIGTIVYCVLKESQWFNMLVEAIGESCRKRLEERKEREKQMKSRIAKRQLDLYKLAQLFYEYEYFSDEKEHGTEYGVLLNIYDTLTQESKDVILKYYDSFKKQKSPLGTER